MWNDDTPGLISSVILLFIYGDMIKGDTAPKKLGLWQCRKPAGVRGQKGGRKDPSPILLCDMFSSPARPVGLVSLLTLQTLGIFAKHKGHNCLPSTSFLPGTEIWILPKGQRRLKVQWLSEALLFDFFSERYVLLVANRAGFLQHYEIRN